MSTSDRLASFWASECGARGPMLPHTHGDCVRPPGIRHSQCACIECGLTPERWMMLVHPSVVRLVPPEADIAIDDKPLELPQGDDLVERGMARGVYPGPDNGPGRGLLSSEWVLWALSVTWLS